jgi:hypothetical protein
MESLRIKKEVVKSFPFRPGSARTPPAAARMPTYGPTGVGGGARACGIILSPS